MTQAKHAARLQSYLHHLEAPPSIDTWNAIIGRGDRISKLGHMLAAWGARLELQPSLVSEETMAIAALDRTEALQLIEMGEARFSKALRRLGAKSGTQEPSEIQEQYSPHHAG